MKTERNKDKNQVEFCFVFCHNENLDFYSERKEEPLGGCHQDFLFIFDFQ